MTSERCGVCRYALSTPTDADPANTLCRRYPPQVIAIMGAQGPAAIVQFPAMNPAAGWCGEFQPERTEH